MFTVYLGAITRSIMGLHTLINNK